jgi:predicted phosphodiesterase
MSQSDEPLTKGTCGMRIAVISDIHGNAVALEAALADIASQGVDQIVCLGDAIQWGPQPAETVQRLRDLRCALVMGNADAWLLTGQETGNEGVTSAQEEVRQWSLQRLSEADRAFIAAFVPPVRLPVTGDAALLCFHGSPASFDDILLPIMSSQAVFPYFQGQDAWWFAGGHTHVQQLRSIGDGFYVNPGSIGVVYRDDQPDDQPDEQARLEPRAEYALLTARGTTVSLEFRRVPFDLTQLMASTRQSGRPHLDRILQDYAP